MTSNDKICWIDVFDIKTPDGKILHAFSIYHDSPINYEENPVLIVKKRDLWPYEPFTKPKWFLVDPIRKEFIKELPRKPPTRPIGFRKYKDPLTGEKRPIILCDSDISGVFCHGCKKMDWSRHGPRAFDILRKQCEDPKFNHIFGNYVNSEGDLAITIKLDPPVIFFIATTKKFELHDYCTKECQKRAKNIRRLNERFRNTSKKYEDLQDNEHPDGSCKICGKDISDKRLGSLTCCPAHRQRYKRRKDHLSIAPSRNTQTNT